MQRWLAYTGPDYRVGTLSYTRRGLFLLFVWLLWGDLVWSLMQMVFPASMPLQLQRLNVPMEWVGYMMGTVAATINMTFVPVISFRSDRTRTRWGRRIPIHHRHGAVPVSVPCGARILRFNRRRDSQIRHCPRRSHRLADRDDRHRDGRADRAVRRL